MQLNLSQDEKLFHEATKDYLDDTIDANTVRAMGEAGGGFDRSYWAQGAELGWTAMLVPEELGGANISGNPLGDISLIAYEFGTHAAPGPLLPTSAVLTGLVLAGAAQNEAISAILSGEAVATWAVYEPNLGFAASLGTGTTFSGGTLNGTKDRVEAADQADLLLVTATSPDGLVQVLVPTDAPGVTVTPNWSLDATRRFATVTFTDVTIGAEAVVQTGDAAANAAEQQFLVAGALAAVEATGATQTAFDLTMQWLTDRYTFGRPLASYQAIKHRIADDKTWLEAMHATSDSAIAALDKAAPDAAELVSVAKSYVGDKSVVIIQDGVQLHGGLGVTWEHSIHLYLRRATVNRALYGTPEEHRARITSLLERKSA